MFGLFPIMWIVFNAIWLYNMTDRHRLLRRILRRSFERISDDGASRRSHRVLLRRPARGPRRLRHARRHHGVDARRPRLQADEGGHGRPRLEHRAGRVRAIAIPIITLAGITDLPKDDLGATTALDQVKLAIAADPLYGEAFNLRGLIYANLGDEPLAEESFRRALQLNPRDADTMHNYGWFLCQQKRYAESNALFSQALAVPQYRGAARTLLAQGVC